MSSYDDDIKKFDEALANLDLIKSDVKQLKKNYISNLKKKGSKTKNSDSTEPKKCYGITEPKVLPPNIYEFIKFCLTKKKLPEEFVNKNNDIFENFTVETKIARTTVNSVIHNYIKANNLYEDENKRSVFKPDAKLKNLFDIEDNEVVNLKNLQTFLKRAYDKYKTNDEVKTKKQSKKVSKNNKVDEVEEVKKDEDDDEDEDEKDKDEEEEMENDSGSE
jgi:hypothetical protein